MLGRPDTATSRSPDSEIFLEKWRASASAASVYAKNTHGWDLYRPDLSACKGSSHPGSSFKFAVTLLATAEVERLMLARVSVVKAGVDVGPTMRDRSANAELFARLSVLETLFEGMEE